MKTVGIVSLAGAINDDRDKIESAKKYFESKGLNVKLSKNIYDSNRYLAGDDEVKISELEHFFADPEIDIIINARGGYGSIRLINRIDYEIIKNNPKPFIGFSDITALLLMIYKRTGIVTYHGPMVISDFADIAPFTEEFFNKAINKEKLEFAGTTIYQRGRAEGIIWGGNLATVVSLCGQDFLPNEDFIFFTEDLNEPVYKIDRMFQQLINIHKFRDKCKGIVLGDFLDVDNTEWLEGFFKDLASNTNIPVIGGFKITHGQEKITIPVGKNCVLHDNKLVIG